MRKSWTRSALSALLATTCAFALWCGSIGAQSEEEPEVAPPPAGGVSFDSSPGLYAAIELGLGGRPLYQKLFPNGWPTTRDYRALTLDQGEAGFHDVVSGYLASGLGLPLSVSSLECDKLRERQKTDQGKAPGSVEVALRERFEVYRQLSGLGGSVDGSFSPVFIPFRRGEPNLAKEFDEVKPWTWAWDNKNADRTVTLDAIGFHIWACASFARHQLAAEHVVDVAGTRTSYVGRNDVDGFNALVALNCAVAAMQEVRQKLCMDARGGGEGQKPSLGAYPRAYRPDGEFARSTFYPHSFIAQLGKATVSWEVGNSKLDQKSRLLDQAALLLGLSELVRTATGKTGSGRFFNGDNKKTVFFDPDTAAQTQEFAAFVVEVLTTLHRHGPSNNYSSFGWREDYGKALRTEDAGLALVALDAFIALKPDKPSNDFLAAQKHAAILLDKIAGFMLTMQKISNPPNTGFCDNYNLEGDGSPADLRNGVERRSLNAQGLIARGFLAARRAYEHPAIAAKKRDRELKDAAANVLRWLEEKRWDKARRAYVDAPGQEKQKLRAFDAFAILGALREMALETGDVRYLLRYRGYLETLREKGIVLAETKRARTYVNGVKPPAEAKRPPVVAAEVSLP